MKRPRVLSVDDAAAALAEAEVVAARWVEDAAGKTHAAERLAAELAEAEARAAEDVLAGDGDSEAVSRIAARLVQLQTEQRVAARAAETAQERLSDARRGLLQARAHGVRARAAALQDVVTARQARTDQMLAELADFERVRFAVEGRTNMGVGASFRPSTLTQQIAGRAEWLDGHADKLDVVAASGSAAEVLSFVTMPLPEVLAVESAAITAAAEV